MRIVRRFNIIIFAVFLNSVINATALAGPAEDNVIAKIVAAYGGDKLVNLRSITIKEDRQHAWAGQGYTPQISELAPIKTDARLDLKQSKGSYEQWSPRWGHVVHIKLLSTGDDVILIDYIEMTRRNKARPNFYGAFKHVIRNSDLLLAREINLQSETATHKNTVTYLGDLHDVIEFKVTGSSSTIEIFVNSKTGLISKMVRRTPSDIYTNTFNNHVTDNGLTYARDNGFFVNTDFNETRHVKIIEFNKIKSKDFKVKETLSLETPRVDMSTMTTDKVRDGVYLTGKSGAYSVFIEDEDYIIGMGGYDGLKARFEAFQADTGIAKPLQYQIVSHHHLDHLGGMKDAYSLGAKLIAPETIINTLKTILDTNIDDDRIISIENQKSIGPVAIHVVATKHAEANAIAYIPSAKVLFQADLYNGTFKNAVAKIDPTSESFARAVTDLNLDVVTLLSAHSRKQENWDKFQAAASKYVPNLCPTQRKICQS